MEEVTLQTGEPLEGTFALQSGEEARIQNLGHPGWELSAI